jgi:hypothetical protein
VTPESLVRTVEAFLTSAGDAVIIEDGAVVFDLAQSKYSTSGERNKCLSHLWSEERNFVRRVLEAEVKNEILRLAVQRLGQANQPSLRFAANATVEPSNAHREARRAPGNALPGGSGSACASRNGHVAALNFTGDRLGVARH